MYVIFVYSAKNIAILGKWKAGQQHFPIFFLARVLIFLIGSYRQQVCDFYRSKGVLERILFVIILYIIILGPSRGGELEYYFIEEVVRRHFCTLSFPNVVQSEWWTFVDFGFICSPRHNNGNMACYVYICVNIVECSSPVDWSFAVYCRKCIHMYMRQS